MHVAVREGGLLQELPLEGCANSVVDFDFLFELKILVFRGAS